MWLMLLLFFILKIWHSMFPGCTFAFSFYTCLQLCRYLCSGHNLDPVSSDIWWIPSPMIILANTNKVSQPGSTPCIWICLRSALMVWKWEEKDVVMCDEVNCSLLIFWLHHDGRTSDHTSSLNLHINVHIQATSSLLHSINLVHPELTWKVVINLWQRCIYIIELALGVGLYNFAQGTHKTFLISQLFILMPPPTLSAPFFMCCLGSLLLQQFTPEPIKSSLYELNLWSVMNSFILG